MPIDTMVAETLSNEREKPRHFNVLFLGAGNSAMFIMAEAVLNGTGFPNFTGYSAGSHPSGKVNPEAQKQIAGSGFPVEGLRSKRWDEFARPAAPGMHFLSLRFRRWRRKWRRAGLTVSGVGRKPI